MLKKSLNAFVLALFVGWVAVFGLVAWTASHHPSPTTKHQTQQTEPAEHNREPSKPTAPNRTYKGEATQHNEDKSEFWSAKLTDWLLAVFTFFLVAFTYRLWKSTENLWKTTDAA